MNLVSKKKQFRRQNTAISIFCKGKYSFLIGQKKIPQVEIVDSSKRHAQEPWKHLGYEIVIGATKPEEEEFQVGRVAHLPVNAALLNHHLSGSRVDVEQPIGVTLACNFVGDLGVGCALLVSISSYHFHHNSTWKRPKRAERWSSTCALQNQWMLLVCSSSTCCTRLLDWSSLLRLDDGRTVVLVVNGNLEVNVFLSKGPVAIPGYTLQLQKQTWLSPHQISILNAKSFSSAKKNATFSYMILRDLLPVQNGVDFHKARVWVDTKYIERWLVDTGSWQRVNNSGVILFIGADLKNKHINPGLENKEKGNESLSRIKYYCY